MRSPLHTPSIFPPPWPDHAQYLEELFEPVASIAVREHQSKGRGLVHITIPAARPPCASLKFWRAAEVDDLKLMMYELPEESAISLCNLLATFNPNASAMVLVTEGTNDGRLLNSFFVVGLASGRSRDLVEAAQSSAA